MSQHSCQKAPYRMHVALRNHAAKHPCEHKALSIHNISLQTIRRMPTMQNMKFTKSQTSDMPNDQLQPSQVTIATCCLSFEPVIAAAKPLGIYD